MSEVKTTKLNAAVLSYLVAGRRLFDTISTGLTILQFKEGGAIAFEGLTPLAINGREEDEGQLVHLTVGEAQKLTMVDSMFLQSIVVTPEHLAEMMSKVKHDHKFDVKAGTEEFNNMFFMEDIDEAGYRNAEFMKQMHVALGINEDTANSDLDLKDALANIELVGVIVNKRREDDVALLDHNYPRARAGAYPQYRSLREKFESNGGEGIYSIAQYTEDYKTANNTSPNINNVVNSPRNWTFTPLFVDKGGNLIK